MAKLSSEQYAAIALLSLPKRNGMTYEQVSEQVGIDVRTLYRWRSDDRFNDELKRKIMRDTLDRLPEVQASIPDHIINDGNAAMYRTMMQSLGLLTDKVEVETTQKGAVDIEAIRERLKAKSDNADK